MGSMLLCFMMLSSYGREPTITEHSGDTFSMDEYQVMVPKCAKKSYTRLFRCRTCGRVFSEDYVRIHSAREGHWEFDRYGY